MNNIRHIVIDMQRLFAEETPWHTPAIGGIIDNVTALSKAYAGRTLFAKFMLPATPEHAQGRWQTYYRRWRAVTTEQMDPALQDLMEPLRSMAAPDAILEKTVYSAFNSPGLADRLKREGVETLIFSGVETDVCVLSSVMDAVDLGFHVIVATDAVASGDMRSHQAVLDHVFPRIGEQVDLRPTAELLVGASIPG